MPDRKLPISYVAILGEVVTQHGGNVDTLLAGSGLNREALADPEGYYPQPDFYALCMRALEITGEPALGLYYGRRLPLTAHGVLGYTLLSCNNMGQALEILMQYHRLLLGDAFLDYAISGEQVRIVFRPLDNTMVSQRFDQEVFFAGLVAAISQLYHRPLDGAGYDFSYEQPPYHQTYREVLGAEPRFGSDVDAITLPRALLDETLEFANPAMLQLYRQQCRQLLDDMETLDGFAAQVRRHLLEHRQRFPSLEESAQHFHMSTRTFRRRLAAEDSRFQGVLDEVRRELAERYLADPRFSSAQVAELLQFSDYSNFRRAFINWTGQSPAQFRDSRRSQRVATE